MSDGITESRRGTYFLDRSKPKPTELEEIKNEMDHLISWNKYLAEAINQLQERIERIERIERLEE